MGSSNSRGTELNSGWRNEQAACPKCHHGGCFLVTKIRWQRHQMWGRASEALAETGRWVVGIATLSISAWFNGGISKALHDAVLIECKCNCGNVYWCTAELSKNKGKEFNWGYYYYYRILRAEREVNVPYERMKEIFDGMTSYYSSVNYNCQHWASEFFNKILRASS